MIVFKEKRRQCRISEKQQIILFFFLFFCFFPACLIQASQEAKKEYLVKYKNTGLEKIILSPAEAEFLNQADGVVYVEPNYLYRAAIIPSDTYFESQWYLKKIKAVEAWDTTREAKDIIIAVIDSGVWIKHPDLADNIWKNHREIPENSVDDDKNGFIDDYNGWDFVNNTADPSPKFSPGYTQDGITHGTIVAGIASAVGNNAAGITGVAWRSKIMPLKVLDDKGEGDTADVVKAIDYAIANGADIINFSFVGQNKSFSLESAIRRAYDAGIIIVAAAGNELSDGHGTRLDESPMYPACHDGAFGENMVIGVAATDALDQKAPFSSYGNSCVDICAPGVSIYSTTVYAPDYSQDNMDFDSYYDGYWSGTSIAAPMVSAASALVQAVNPKLSTEEIKQVIFDSADDISRLNPDYPNMLGSGRLNVAQAVRLAGSLLSESRSRLIISPYKDNDSKVMFADKQGVKINDFWAYHENFRGGVNVAVGDVDGDGQEEIITGAGFSGGPHVRVFDSGGNLKSQFFAYHENFRGGVNVAVGDVDGDGQEEIITGAGFSGGPQVRIFASDGRVEGQFFAYDKNFRGGVNVAVIDTDSKARNTNSKIITAPGKGGGPQLRLFDNYGKIINQFFAFHEKFRGGVNIASGDINEDGLEEIIVGAGPGGAPHARIFDKFGVLQASFYAYDDNFRGGINVSMINITD